VRQWLSVSGPRAVVRRIRHPHHMEFSWWTWSGLVIVALGGLGLIGRACVMAVRRDGIARARAERGPSAPWFWSGIGLLVATGALLALWVLALDS
jgi:hypothetical protein